MQSAKNDKSVLRALPVYDDDIYEGLDAVYWLENNGPFLILIREL